ncbi:MAG: FliH/SctL family protein [Endozoicomonas sp.]
MSKRMNVNVFRFPGPGEKRQKADADSTEEGFRPLFAAGLEYKVGSDVQAAWGAGTGSKPTEAKKQRAEKAGSKKLLAKKRAGVAPELSLSESQAPPDELAAEQRPEEKSGPADPQLEDAVSAQGSGSGDKAAPGGDQQDCVDDAEVQAEAAGTLPPQSEASQSSQQPEHDPEKLKALLDDMYQQGLEQGRREGRAELEESVRQQAMSEGREEGYASGHQQGIELGLQEGQAGLGRQMVLLRALQQKLESYEVLLSDDQVHQAARLLERLLVEVVRAELKLAPEHILDLVQQAVSLLDRTDKESLRVHVHPEDMPWLEPLKTEEKGRFIFLSDDQLLRGGCRIEGGLGDIDATLETRLTTCIEQFRDNVLDDPENSPEPDFSPLRQPGVSAGRQHERKPVSRSVAPVEVSEEPMTVAFEPTAEAAEGLGAWGALGQ